MQIVGIDRADWEETHVHTVDLWYSKRRNVWVVERLSAAGHIIGSTHYCPTADDAAACLADWLRVHDETHLVSPRELAVVCKQGTADKPTSRAA